MKNDPSRDHRDRDISRRNFMKVGGAVLAGGSLALSGSPVIARAEPDSPGKLGIREHRRLGRTEFKASDISLGAGRINEPDVVRYAYDNGINYFDTAEVYGNGDSETKIGQAMQFMDRKKIFITTKLWIKDEDTEQTILDRYAKCLERMQTEYADALMLHGIGDAKWVTHEGFHSAVAKLKADGRLKHAGVSSHGPREEEPDSMEKVLMAAVDDGRFDVFLLVYSFMNFEEGERILKACKEKDIGTTAMKTAPGVIDIDIEPFDPENPSELYAGYLENIMERGSTREEAVERIQNYLAEHRVEQEEALVKTKPFLKKHGIDTDEQLQFKSVQWVLNNPDMHTICISMPGFESLDKYIPLSGTRLSRADEAFLRDFEYAHGKHYCRHACDKCVASCPHGLPVSTIMRYAYYYTGQGREKFAMSKYARLSPRNASACLACNGLCQGACPHGLNIQSNLLKAHSLLTLA